MYKLILDDLKTDFPDKKILTLGEVAKLISKSSMGLYKLRDRGNLSIPFKKIGNRYCISIYEFAKWLDFDADVEVATPIKKEIRVAPTVKKPKRQGVPIGKMLF